LSALTRALVNLSIILLEFNTVLFSKLLLNLKNYPGNIILVNQRRSAIWNKKAIDAVQKSNSKILNFNKILTTNEKLRIPILVEEYSKKLDIFWKNSELFETLFQIENSSFWNMIKDIIIKSYNEKLPHFIFSFTSFPKNSDSTRYTPILYISWIFFCFS